jgi:hypothetical protein
VLTFGYDLEATGPSPFENKIITIQYRRNGQNHIFKIWDYDHSEKELILSFLNAWRSIPLRLSHGGDYFVAYNLRLCAPFLLTRCLLNEIAGDLEQRKHLWSSIIHGPAFLDLYQLMGDKLTRFDVWRNRLGVASPRFKNFDVPHMYHKRMYSEIEEYVSDELVALEEVYHALTKQPFYTELEKLRSELWTESVSEDKPRQ